MRAKSLQPSLTGSLVHGILQARIQEWVAISSSRGSSWSRDGTCNYYLAGGFFTTEPPEKPSLRGRDILNIKKRKSKRWEREWESGGLRKVLSLVLPVCYKQIINAFNLTLLSARTKEKSFIYKIVNFLIHHCNCCSAKYWASPKAEIQKVSLE